jgi:hypothetical protein
MPTKDKANERERLRRYIESNGLGSQMNNTKWQVAIKALLAIPDYRPVFRVRRVRDIADAGSRWDASFPEHVPTYVEIEWLDVRRTSTHQPARDMTVQIISALQAAQVPFVECADAIRIVGYTRPPRASSA